LRDFGNATQPACEAPKIGVAGRSFASAKPVRGAPTAPGVWLSLFVDITNIVLLKEKAFVRVLQTLACKEGRSRTGRTLAKLTAVLPVGAKTDLIVQNREAWLLWGHG
jgi:hypothetical protein